MLCIILSLSIYIYILSMYCMIGQLTGHWWSSQSPISQAEFKEWCWNFRLSHGWLLCPLNLSWSYGVMHWESPFISINLDGYERDFLWLTQSLHSLCDWPLHLNCLGNTKASILMKAFRSSVSESGTKIKATLPMVTCLFDLCFPISNYSSLG